MKIDFKFNQEQAFTIFVWLTPVGNIVFASMLWLWLLESDTNRTPYVEYVFLVVLK